MTDREDRSTSGPAPANPFAALRAKLGDKLPAGPTPPQPKPKAEPKPLATTERVTLRRERAGHAGKTVTHIEGPGLAGRNLEALARELARALGLGARTEDGALVVQGDPGDRLVAWLENRGFARVERGS